jgi:hypothetical protein
MDQELLGIIEKEVATFRYGAPITIYDIRVVAEVDGHDLSKWDGRSIGIALAKICEVRDGPYGRRDYRSFYRRCPQ